MLYLAIRIVKYHADKMHTHAGVAVSFGVSFTFFFILLIPIFLCGAKRGRKKATNHQMIYLHDLYSQRIQGPGIYYKASLMHAQ